MNNLNLINAFGEYSNEVVYMMNNIIGIKEIFKDRIDRLSTSIYSCLIKMDEKTVVFVNLVEEKNNKNFLFVDMGIIPEFRNKSICNDILTYFSNFPTKEFIIGETKVDNQYANKAAAKVGILVLTNQDSNFYLIQKNRYEEFIQNNCLEQLKEHIEKGNQKKLIISRTSL